MECLAENYHRSIPPGVTPLVARTSCRNARPAAVNASTVFAIALAILAGLIFTWLVKNVLLTPKSTPKPVDETEMVTVAASNIRDQWEIKPNQVKQIKMPKAQFLALSKSNAGRTILKGQQPVGRMTKKPINAEELIYDDDLMPFTYPEPFTLKKRMRACIITVGAKDAMIRTGDYVDVYCTLNTGEVLGTGGIANTTAEIARGCKVVARFGTTAKNAQPRDPNAPREYTLEVTPYRFALIELAKKDGAQFALTNAPPIVEGDQVQRPDGNDPEKEPRADLVTHEDLEYLFGVARPKEGPGPWDVQKVVGIRDAGSTRYPGYVPPSRQGTGTTTPTTPSNSPPQSRTRPSSDTVPVSSVPRQRPTFDPTRTVASAGTAFGSPLDPNGKKK